MFRRAILSILLLITWACTTQQTARQATPAAVSAETFMFLTRGRCVNTDTMRSRLEDAPKAMGSNSDTRFLILDTLPGTDARRGYPTPTLL